MTSNIQIFPILIKSTDNNIGEEGTIALSDALKTNTTLTKLNLRGNQNSFQNLFLSFHFYKLGNMIGGTGAKSLNEAFMINSSITKLDLSRKHTKTSSITRMTHFQPTENSIADEGLTSLSTFLKSNTTIIQIDLMGLYNIQQTFLKASLTVFHSNRQRDWRQWNQIIK